MKSFPTVNQAAFFTTTALAVATGGSAYLAATAASKAALVAYAALGITGSALSFASITAWIHTKGENNRTVTDYFQNMKTHATGFIPVVYQFVAQKMIKSLIEGIAKAVRDAVYEAIMGRRSNDDESNTKKA